MADKDIKELLSKLSQEQRKSLKNILDRDAGPTRLSDDQMRTIIDNADSYRKAQRQATDALGVLWNAQLDTAIQSRDPSRIDNAILRPGGEVAFYDNCNCSGGGTGPASW